LPSLWEIFSYYPQPPLCLLAKTSDVGGDVEERRSWGEERRGQGRWKMLKHQLD